MNSVQLIGRLVKDPDSRRSSQNAMPIARFSIAIDRGKDKNGVDLGVDFPNIVCFGKTAELVERYLSKGRLVGISGRINTGSYEKDGKKMYTTEVVAERVEFLDKGEQNKENLYENESVPSPDFTGLTLDDIPF